MRSWSEEYSEDFERKLNVSIHDAKVVRIELSPDCFVISMEQAGGSGYSIQFSGLHELLLNGSLIGMQINFVEIGILTRDEVRRFLSHRKSIYYPNSLVGETYVSSLIGGDPVLWSAVHTVSGSGLDILSSGISTREEVVQAQGRRSPV